jgi:putative phosphoribosyl transferase
MTGLIAGSDPHHRLATLHAPIFRFNTLDMTATDSHEIEIPAGQDVFIKGDLIIPDQCNAVIIFSHGSGSSRFSVRNRFVAAHLNKNHFATLLMDLLTPAEDHEYRNRFDIDLLTDRLVLTTAYLQTLPELAAYPIGYFGASTGAASALKASARFGEQIFAVVSRGGRPDLAEESLVEVRSPVLLIVGSLDLDVITLNKQALDGLRKEKKMVIVKGASHLFEERGKLEEVAVLAEEWFSTHLR